jgi:hypothetical protein
LISGESTKSLDIRKENESDTSLSQSELFDVRSVCARSSLFRWLDRVDLSTGTRKARPLRLGEVVVEELSSGRILKRAEGIDLIWRNIAVYAPFRLLLRVPSFRRYLEKNVGGCEGTACEVSSKPGAAVHQ